MVSPSSKTVYQVSELSDILRGLVESALPSVWVQGEVSNFRNPSGHWYFTLKDANAQLRCAMFKGKNFHVKPVPRDGDAVQLRGQVSFYTQRGDLQLIVDHIEPAGQGALLRAFEQLKQKLAAEGLFDEKLKRPLPAAPRAIGIITSATAAAYQDILTTLARRYPLAPVYLYPVPVQGDTAPPAIIQALAELPRLAPVEVILLARGGGSLEDLWCFNDERIARAIRACAVPVVTGIGHEIDFTIADFAADLRAPTPTGAAEQVSPLLDDWREALERNADDLTLAVENAIALRQEALERGSQRIQRLHPGRRLEEAAQRLDELQERLQVAATQTLRQTQMQARLWQSRLNASAPAQPIQARRQRVSHAALRLHTQMNSLLQRRASQLQQHQAVLASLNPHSVLERGYAIARRKDGSVLRDAAMVAAGEEVEVVLAKGRFEAVVRK